MYDSTWLNTTKPQRIQSVDLQDWNYYHSLPGPSRASGCTVQVKAESCIPLQLKRLSIHIFGPSHDPIHHDDNQVRKHPSPKKRSHFCGEFYSHLRWWKVSKTQGPVQGCSWLTWHDMEQSLRHQADHSELQSDVVAKNHVTNSTWKPTMDIHGWCRYLILAPLTAGIQPLRRQYHTW